MHPEFLRREESFGFDLQDVALVEVPDAPDFDAPDFETADFETADFETLDWAPLAERIAAAKALRSLAVISDVSGFMGRRLSSRVAR